MNRSETVKIYWFHVAQCLQWINFFLGTLVQKILLCHICCVQGLNNAWQLLMKTALAAVHMVTFMCNKDPCPDWLQRNRNWVRLPLSLSLQTNAGTQCGASKKEGRRINTRICVLIAGIKAEDCYLMPESRDTFSRHLYHKLMQKCSLKNSP